MGTRICIWKTDGGDDTSIPLGCADKVRDLDLAGESAHLVAVVTEDITILSIPSGDVQRTLYRNGAENVRISHDGSFLASWIRRGEARLWSITQGTLLATFRTVYNPVFSRTNRLYVADDPGRVYDMSADPEIVSIKSFPLPSPIYHVWVHIDRSILPILPTPDESRILIRTENDIQVCSLKFTDHTRNAPRHDITGIDISGDASLLALATRTGIEIWDARIGQRLHVVQSRSSYSRPVAFSPKGELIVSKSDDGIIVVDVRAGVLMPTTYSFSPQGQNEGSVKWVGISFDSSKLAAIKLWYGPSHEQIHYLCVWDLPSGTLLHSLECGDTDVFQWSWTDQYLLFKPWRGNPQYLNAETFQEEVLEHPGDRFQGPSHLYHEFKGNMLRIRLSSGREEPLFSALPSNLVARFFSSRGDRACIFSGDRQLLLLNTSGLETYMEICRLHFEPDVSRIEFF